VTVSIDYLSQLPRGVMQTYLSKLASNGTNFMPNSEERLLDFLANPLKEVPYGAFMMRLDAGELSFTDWRALFLGAAQRCLHGPSTFALAAAHCPDTETTARDYMVRRAHDDKNCWLSAVSDLKNIGYQGGDPKEVFPTPANQACIALGYFTALKSPLARLAIDAAERAVARALGQLAAAHRLKRIDCYTDSVILGVRNPLPNDDPAKEVLSILDRCVLPDMSWAGLLHTAKTTATLIVAAHDAALQPSTIRN
jgi:hypothetical protein